MQNLSRLELTDIPFVLSEGELLKVSVFSVHATIAISHKRAAIQISVCKLMATRIQLKFHCHCVTVKGISRRNFHLAKFVPHRKQHSFCCFYQWWEGIDIWEKFLKIKCQSLRGGGRLKNFDLSRHQPNPTLKWMIWRWKNLKYNWTDTGKAIKKEHEGFQNKV